MVKNHKESNMAVFLVNISWKGALQHLLGLFFVLLKSRTGSIPQYYHIVCCLSQLWANNANNIVDSQLGSRQGDVTSFHAPSSNFQGKWNTPSTLTLFTDLDSDFWSKWNAPWVLEVFLGAGPNPLLLNNNFIDWFWWT